MTEEQFNYKMQFARPMGINIASKNLVWTTGFIGTYKHIFGVKVDEVFAEDAVIHRIAGELLALQGASRLLVGKFFHASINFMGGTFYIETFYDEQGVGVEYRKELDPKFIQLMHRLTWWLNDKSVVSK